MNNANYEWLFLIPEGWMKIAQQMIEECEAINPTYTIEDMKEKWGELRVVSYIKDYNDDEWLLPASNDKEIEEIENKCIAQSARTCCKCGKPAIKYSTGWILPWCDDCGTKKYGPYKEFNHDSTATNNN